MGQIRTAGCPCDTEANICPHGDRERHSTGYLPWSATTPTSPLFNSLSYAATARIEPSEDPVSSRVSEILSIVSTDRGWPRILSFWSPKSPQVKQQRMPVWEPHTTLVPSLTMASDINSSS